MAEKIEERLEEKGMECCHCHQKATPRSEKERKQLQNRLSRMTGQLNGISRMLEENRYCGDILTQVAAVESALQAFGYAILKEHMETCVVEEIRKGNTAIVEEAVDLVKKIEISRGMTADKTVNSCGKALKITETLQIMERQGYFYEGKISCYGNVLLRMLFACGKGSQ